MPLVKQCRSHRSKKAAQELGRASPASSPSLFASQHCLHRISPGTQLRSPPCGSPQAFPALDAPAHDEAVLCSELCTAASMALLPPALLGRGPGGISGALNYWMGAARCCKLQCNGCCKVKGAARQWKLQQHFAFLEQHLVLC